ncbi:T9SS type A sorting domain-containing protein [Fluviicola sp.]|uniref:T9SS type A sorting domain-containing protein n=1 Tax=Fluviicola sp. TaxID=1917219 RepID=UPI002609A5ED|nr:T9SS type A sorting domain-containing protein [Fluviicola sp.]
MKKLLLSLGVVASSLSLSAQTITNGNLDAAMTAIPGTAYTYSIPGWVGLNAGPESASPFQGTQAAKLVVTNDPALNTALNWGDDIIPGLLQQRVAGTITNPANIEASLAYKFTKMGTDTAYIEIAVVDTMGVGANDDVVMYADWLEIPASVGTWTVANFQMQTINATGNPNRFYILAVSSTKGYYDTQTPTVGSTLWIDDVRVGKLGLEANTLSNVSVYPNPATSVLNIDSKEAISSVNVMTTDGKVVATSTSANVNVEALNAGMYIYQVTTVSGKVETGNFAKN